MASTSRTPFISLRVPRCSHSAGFLPRRLEAGLVKGGAPISVVRLAHDRPSMLPYVHSSTASLVRSPSDSWGHERLARKVACCSARPICLDGLLAPYLHTTRHDLGVSKNAPGIRRVDEQMASRSDGATNRSTPTSEADGSGSAKAACECRIHRGSESMPISEAGHPGLPPSGPAQDRQGWDADPSDARPSRALECGRSGSTASEAAHGRPLGPGAASPGENQAAHVGFRAASSRPGPGRG